MTNEVQIEMAPTVQEAASDPTFRFTTDEAAVKYIQRKWKGRHLRRMLARFPSIDQLKSMYLDPKAQAAGAATSKWYTGLALAAREHVRLSDEVNDCCREAWIAINEAARHWAGERAREVGLAAKMAPDDIERSVLLAQSALDHGLTREVYDVMSQKLYILGKLQEEDDDIDANDMLETAQEDWEDDTGGAPLLTEEAFKRSWFQLIDLHVESIDAEEYVEVSRTHGNGLYSPLPSWSHPSDPPLALAPSPFFSYLRDGSRC